MNLASIIPLADTWVMHGGWGWAGMTVMMIGMVLFWGAIILGIVWVARGGFNSQREERRETPREILDRRFAEGTISAEDYHQRQEVISNSSR